MSASSSSLDWNRIRAFVATVEAGSLSAASRSLGLTQPTLSRQVAALEEELGVILFERVGRSLSLTHAGGKLLAHARAMGDAADHLSLAASGQSEAVEGLVRITAGDMMAAYVLPEVLEKLGTRAPGIEIEVIASNTVDDLMRREADIAIRHIEPDQPDLIAHRARDTSGHLYATTSYLDRIGRPTTPEGFADAALIGYTDRVDEVLARIHEFGLPLGRHNVKWITASGVVAWEMVKKGLGMTLMVRDVAALTPGVELVLPDRPALPVPIWLTTHRELHTSRRIRTVFDVLVETFG